MIEMPADIDRCVRVCARMWKEEKNIWLKELRKIQLKIDQYVRLYVVGVVEMLPPSSICTDVDDTFCCAVMKYIVVDMYTHSRQASNMAPLNALLRLK